MLRHHTPWLQQPGQGGWDPGLCPSSVTVWITPPDPTPLCASSVEKAHVGVMVRSGHGYRAAGNR